MTKTLLNNYLELESLFLELKADTDTPMTFQDENNPKSYPCIAVYIYADDVDFGSAYNIAYVYPSDFNS